MSPADKTHVFQRIKISGRNLIKMYPKNIHVKFSCNQESSLREDDLQDSIIIHTIEGNKPPSPPHLFYPGDKNFLKESDKNSSKEHSCEI